MTKNIHNVLLESCRLIMRPVAQFFISSGFQYNDFVDVARGEFVRAACETTDASESMTSIVERFGISRREFAKFRGEEKLDASKIAYELSFPAVVISRWFQDTNFVDEDGAPRSIDRREFDLLISRAGLDVKSEEIFRELLESETIQEQPDGTFLPTKRIFVPLEGDPRHLLRFGVRVGDLANTLYKNSISENPTIEASAYNSHVKISQIPMLRNVARTQAKSLLQSIDDWLTAHSDPNSDNVVRAGIGLYFFEDDSEF